MDIQKYNNLNEYMNTNVFHKENNSIDFEKQAFIGAALRGIGMLSRGVGAALKGTRAVSSLSRGARAFRPASKIIDKTKGGVELIRSGNRSTSKILSSAARMPVNSSSRALSRINPINRKNTLSRINPVNSIRTLSKPTVKQMSPLKRYGLAAGAGYVGGRSMSSSQQQNSGSNMNNPYMRGGYGY